MTEREIFAAAIDIQDADERNRFLDDACRGDAALRERIEALLAERENLGSYLEVPAAPVETIDRALGPRTGARFGPYKLLQELGQGGMGTVYLAEQQQPVKRQVALKIIKPGMDSAQVIARFEQERQALAIMDHPHIAKVLDAGATDSGRPYFVMELVKGIPITRYCDQEHLSPADRLKLFIPICQAVQHAHQKGIIHRDLKPSNVLIALYDGQPVPKVIDFGVAKATSQKMTERTLFTEVGSIVGTLEYMAPEQAELNNLDIDTRADIYSLGVLLYELLTGAPPFSGQQLRGAGFNEMLRIIKEVEPQKPSTKLSGSVELLSIAANRRLEPARLTKLVRGDLDWIVMKCLEKDRTRRYETASGLSRDIEHYLHDETVEACPPSTSYRLRKLARRHSKALAVVTAFVMLLLAATVTSFALASWAFKEREIAVVQRQLAQTNEKEAKEKANEIRAVLDFVDNQVFAAARPLGQEGGLGRDVTLRQAMESALPYVEESFRGELLIEARLRTTVGASFLYLGDGKTAEAQFKRASEIRAASLGTDHPDTLSAMNGLGSSYFAQSRHREAQELQKKTLEIQTASLGRDHPDTLRSANSLAASFAALARPDKAIELLEPTWQLQKAKLGPDHADTLRSLSNLGLYYSATGKHEEALKLCEEALQRRTAKYGPHHALTLNSMRNLARSYVAVGRHAEGLNLHEETLRLRKEILGLDHRATLISMADVALSYHALGRHADALQLREETLPLTKAKFGEDGYETLFLLNGLAQSYSALGRDEEAAKVREEMRQGMKGKPGRTSQGEAPAEP